MTQHDPVLKNAAIRWDGNTPINNLFDDCYYSKHNGIKESQYVYLKGNRLPCRWQEIDRSKQSKFSILETGFGTGLNFLTTTQSWFDFQQTCQPVNLGKLIYTSIEGFPLSRKDLISIIKSWPITFTLSESLIEFYPPSIEGIYTLDFGCVELKLIQMPINQALSEFEPKGKSLFDCLYLDGFSPSRNSQMWHPSTLRKLSFLCKNESSFSTFTASADVRRCMSHAGYKVNKIKGFGKKREMLTGILKRPTLPRYKSRTPWFYFVDPGNSVNEPVTIIGAGVAGCATAHALARQGIASHLIDSQPCPGGTIRDFQACIYAPAMTADFNLSSQFYWHGYLRLEYYLIENPQIKHDNCGVFFIADTPKREQTLNCAYKLLSQTGIKIKWISKKLTERYCGLSVNYPGLLMDHGGWINPESYCRCLIDNPLITTSFNTTIDRLNYHCDRWKLDISGQIISSKYLILCCGHNTGLTTTFGLGTLKTIKGQATAFSCANQLLNLQVVLNNGHYLLSGQSDKDPFMTGSSYEHDYADPDLPSKQIDLENLARFYGVSNKLTQTLKSNSDHYKNNTTSIGPVGLRLASRDHLPLVGPVPDINFYERHYSKRLNKESSKRYPNAEYLPGLYINTAHGSRGITSSLLSGETIASMISGQQFPLPSRLYQGIHPGRFFVRDAII